MFTLLYVYFTLRLLYFTLRLLYFTLLYFTLLYLTLLYFTLLYISEDIPNMHIPLLGGGRDTLSALGACHFCPPYKAVRKLAPRWRHLIGRLCTVHA